MIPIAKEDPLQVACYHENIYSIFQNIFLTFHNMFTPSCLNDKLPIIHSFQGSCQVMKCLKGVAARLGIPKKDMELDEEHKLPVLNTGEQSE